MRFDGNRYSVPRRCAFRPVTVKGYVDRVEVVADGQVVARHARSYGRRRAGPRPAALPGDAGAQAGGAGPRPGLPRLAAARGVRRAAPGDLEAAARRRAPARGSTSASCNCWPSTRWRASQQAIEACLRAGAGYDVERDRSAAADGGCARPRTRPSPSLDRPVHASRPVPGAAARPGAGSTSYSSRGETTDDANANTPAAEGQPEAAAAADDAGRVREAGPRGGRPPTRPTSSTCCG